MAKNLDKFELKTKTKHTHKQECTLISKERRHALRITQGPRSRASLAALPCHSSFQTSHSSLGATYNFQLCDSVPDLSGSGGFESNSISMLTNHSLSSSSAPRKIPMKNGNAFHTSSSLLSSSSSSAAANAVNNNNFLMNGYGTPLRMQNHNNNNKKSSIATSTPINTSSSSSAATTAATATTTPPSAASTTTDYDYDNDDNVVQLRRRNAFMSNASYENNTNDKHHSDWMYRRPNGPNAPNDIRHSCKSHPIIPFSILFSFPVRIGFLLPLFCGFLLVSFCTCFLCFYCFASRESTKTSFSWREKQWLRDFYPWCGYDYDARQAQLDMQN